MKRFLLSVVLATSLALTSCQFDDSDIWEKFGEMEESIRDHEQRISALEELCKQMNTNIEALQTLVDALEKRDYITNISPIREDGVVVGYTISFAYSDTATIYHGQDGQNGANGKDGYTPQIGVMKDTDGIYYWTLDGEWLLDGKGNKIQANGVNGTNGSNGTNGTNGVDGITPRLKIENDYWFVSYDNGVTWQQLGKATGEGGTDGSDGADGEDGDSIFKSVTQDDEYVYFNLADGAMITLPKHDKENIQFEDLQVKAICCKNWDTNNDSELSYAEAAAVETIGTIFKGNTNIIAFTELKYFTGLTEIPENAFNGCTALWKIKIPESVQIIGGYAFQTCALLTSITIPDSVTSVGFHAFYNCTSMELIFINSSRLENISTKPSGISAFEGCSGKMHLNSNLSDGVSATNSAYGYVVRGGICSQSLFTEIVVGEDVSYIGDYAFYNSQNLERVYVKTSIPPTLGEQPFHIEDFYHFSVIRSDLVIFVPSDQIEIYKEKWSIYKSYIQPYDFE